MKKLRLALNDVMVLQQRMFQKNRRRYHYVSERRDIKAEIMEANRKRGGILDNKPDKGKLPDSIIAFFNRIEGFRFRTNKPLNHRLNSITDSGRYLLCRTGEKLVSNL